MGTRGLVTLTKKDQDKIFAKLTSASKETIDVRAEKTKLNNPQINLSNNELFESHVRNIAWKPMQNHGLNDSSIELYAEDQDWPMQVKAYLNLVKDEDLSAKRIVDIGCGWGRGVHTIAKYHKANITGIDNEGQCIEYARQNYPQQRTTAALPNLSSNVNLIDWIIGQIKGLIFVQVIIIVLMVFLEFLKRRE